MTMSYEEQLADKRPFRRRQLIALGLLCGATIGALLCLLWYREADHQTFATIMLHAFEGAVVGGLCDWYAVVKTYRAVEVNRNAVADGIGRWVASELLSHHVIYERITALLHDKSVQDQLVLLLDQRLGQPSDMERWLSERWGELEPTLIEWGRALRLDETALEDIDATFLDQRLTRAVETCLGTALLDLAKAPELDDLVEMALRDTNWFLKLVGGLNTSRIRSELQRVGGDLRDRAYEPAPDGEGAAKMLALAMPPLRHALAGYIKGWNALDDDQRGAAVAATLGHLKAPLIDATVELMHRLRTELRNAETLMELSLFQNLVETLKETLDQSASDRIGEVVTGALKNQAPDVFRRNLENHTRNHLELIRINGTVLGFAAGAGFGLLLSLVGHA